MANLVTPCHGAEVLVNIVYDGDEGDSVNIWCGEPTCYNTWDGQGRIEDEYTGEDPYEYAAQSIKLKDSKAAPLTGFDWTTKEDAEAKVNRMNDTYSRNGYGKYYTVELVKRRKAGKIQKA